MAKKQEEKEQKYVSKYLTVTLTDGSKKKLRFRGKNEDEAKEKCDEARLKVKMGLLTFNDNTPFTKVAEQYYKVYVKPKSSEFGADMIWGIVDRLFISDLGAVPISNIKPTLLKGCFNKAIGLSKSYNDKLYSFINGMFRMATIDGLISSNPMASIEKEKGKSGSRRALTEYEREIFWKVVPKHEKGLAFAIMMASGLRPGEVRALYKTDIDLDNLSINVDKAFKKQKKRNHESLDLKEPKTEAGIRKTPIPDILYDILKDKPKEFGYLVTNENGKPLTEQAFNRAWKSFYRLMQMEAGAELYRNKIVVYSDKIGRDLTPYYLRHTFATVCAENNVPIKVAQEWMGHADSKMLMDIYTHVSEQMKEQAKQIIASLYKPKKEEENPKANEKEIEQQNKKEKLAK